MWRNLTLSVLLGTSPALWAHAGGDHGDVEPFIEVLSQIADFSPEMVSPESHRSHAVIRVGGQSIALNGAFWQIVRGWVRAYYHEIQHECDHCLPESEEAFLAKAEDQMAQTFFELKVSTPLRESIEHIAVGTADIGARLGTTALVAKATSEVAETVLSKMIGGGGVHVVCTMIDGVIIFGTRHLQSAWRSFAWAPRFESWGATQWARQAFVSVAASRALKRVEFVAVGDVDPEALKAVDLEGPNRWWGWADGGKRAQWVQKLVRKGGAKLNRREYLGGRMKRYVLLKGRKRGHSQFMRGQTPMDQTLNQSVLWVMAVQENILQRSLRAEVAQAAREEAPSAASLYANRQDEIREGLAAEFGDAEKMNGLLKEVEVVFNPAAPSRLRYAQAQILESLLVGFVYGTFSRVLGEKAQLYGGSWSGIGRQFRLHWRAGRFASYIHEWADFLRLAALQTDADRLNLQKYESMESMVRLFRLMSQARPLIGVNSAEALEKFEQEFVVAASQLKTFRPWREKRIAYTWLPWRNPQPLCSDMNRKVGSH